MGYIYICNVAAIFVLVHMNDSVVNCSIEYMFGDCSYK